MKIKVSELTTERKWRASTGMNKERFYKLLGNFEESYKETYGKSIADKQASEKRFEFCISDEEELLYFTLFSLKSGLTYDLLGLVCGMNGASAKKNQAIGLKVLEQALKDYMPKRKIKTKKDFEKLFEGNEELLIDATEQPKQRPSDKEEQKNHYSGKKKPMIMVFLNNCSILK